MVLLPLFSGDFLQVSVDTFIRLSNFGFRHAYDLTIDGQRDTSVKLLRLATKPLLAVMSTLSDGERNEIKIVLRRISVLQIELRNKGSSYKTRRKKAKTLLHESKELYRHVETTSAHKLLDISLDGTSSSSYRLYKACAEKNVDAIDLVKYILATLGGEDANPPMPAATSQAAAASDTDQDDGVGGADELGDIDQRAEESQLQLANHMQAITLHDLIFPDDSAGPDDVSGV